jgi:cytolysin (calcineurin-like family phosphatase)
MDADEIEEEEALFASKMKQAGLDLSKTEVKVAGEISVCEITNSVRYKNLLSTFFGEGVDPAGDVIGRVDAEIERLGAQAQNHTKSLEKHTD